MNGQPIEVEDDTLVQAARDDRDAFDALYRRHVDQVYRYCYSRVGHRADAEDLTAQTFLAALQGLPKYDGRGSFVAWVFGIARRKCADHYRRQYANPGAPLEGVDDGLGGRHRSAAARVGRSRREPDRRLHPGGR